MQEQTGIQPPALANRPTLSNPWSYYMECFYEVTTDRGYDQGYPLRLTTQQLEVYRRIFGVLDTPLEFQDRLRLIDRVYLAELRKYQDAKTKK